MKERLLDPRVISEKHDPEGREQILATASLAESELKTVKEKIPLHEARKKEIAERLSVLEKEAEKTVVVLADRLKTLIVRLKIKIGIGDSVASGLEAKNTATETEKQALLEELNQIEVEVENLKAKLKDAPAPQELLDAYHEKMLDTPLTNEEKREFLKPETLASLTTEEYVQLWRRLNPYYLSHVTRQGLRDHNAMIYHSAGMNEFHDGFVGVIENDKEIKTPLAIQGLDFGNEDSIRKFLEQNGVFKTDDVPKNLKEWEKQPMSRRSQAGKYEKIDQTGQIVFETEEEKAYANLDTLLNFSMATAPKYPDKTAVHFAAQIVADDYYGGEKDNEVFFLYPSDVIASQYNYSFNGGEKTFTKPPSDTKWNDVFVWPNSTKENGLPVDAGLVFLPNKTLVDSETGSRYASAIKTVDGREKRVVVEDKETPKAFSEWVSGMNEQTPVVVAFKKLRETHDWQQQDECREEFHRLLLSDLKKIGFNDGVIPELISYLTDKFGWTKEDCILDEKVIPEVIKTYSGGKKRAENPITAKEFWEKYFEQHPDQKPKHIIFYDGDPTRAVQEFQQKNKIGRADTSPKDGKLLGFNDRFVSDMKQDSRSNQGYAELRATAEKIIREHYSLAT